MEQLLFPDIDFNRDRENFRRLGKLNKKEYKDVRKGKYYNNVVKDTWKPEKYGDKATKYFYSTDFIPLDTGKNTLLIATIIHDTMVKSIIKQNLKMKGTDYKVVLHALFLTDDEKVVSFESLVDTSISVDNIVKKLQEMKASYAYLLTLMGVSVKIFKKSTSGGCNETKKSKYPTWQLDGNSYKLESPVAVGENCGIMCIIKALGLKGTSHKPDTIRKKLNIPLNTKLTFDDLVKVSDYFNNLGYNNGFCLYGDDGTFVEGCCHNLTDFEVGNVDFKVNEKVIIHLLLMSNHYYLVKTCSKKCNECGKIWFNKHTCNLKMKISYMNKCLKKKTLTIKTKPKQDLLNYDKDLICFDLETFQCGVKHTPYAVGAIIDGVYKSHYGEGCLKKFIEDLKDLEGTKILTAYNSSGFDSYFIIDYLTELGMTLSNIIINSGKVLSFDFELGKCKFKVFDLYLFTLCSLDNACKAYNTETKKGEFNHKLIQSWNDTEKYRGTILDYLEKDVKSFREVYEKYNDLMYSIEGINISNYITLSHMGYSIWNYGLKYPIEIFNDFEKYDFVNRAKFGGRVHPLESQFVSSQYDDIINGKVPIEEIKDGKVALDVNSLYPAVMAGFECDRYYTFNKEEWKRELSKNFVAWYPVGHSRWSEDGLTEFKNDKLGFYYIEFKPPNIRLPYLLRKHKGELIHSVKAGSGVYSSVDIEGALICGYTITKFGRCLVWDEKASDIFTDYVNKFVEMKIQASIENNKVKRQVAKTMLNALFGKFLQQPINSTVKVCSTLDEVWNFFNNYDTKHCDILNKSIILKGEDLHKETNITKPNFIGTLILSYSKRWMLHLMLECDITLNSDDIFSYTDTDSVYVSMKNYNKLKDLGYLHDTKLGYLSNDIDDNGIVIRQINLSPKCYMVEYINDKGELFIFDDAKKKCKGISTKYLTSELYEECNSEMFGNIFVNKNIKMSGLKKICLNVSKGEEQRGLKQFSITNNEFNRGFNVSTWSGMILKDGLYYPLHYKFT